MSAPADPGCLQEPRKQRGRPPGYCIRGKPGVISTFGKNPRRRASRCVNRLNPDGTDIYYGRGLSPKATETTQRHGRFSDPPGTTASTSLKRWSILTASMPSAKSMNWDAGYAADAYWRTRGLAAISLHADEMPKTKTEHQDSVWVDVAFQLTPRRCVFMLPARACYGTSLPLECQAPRIELARSAELAGMAARIWLEPAP